MYTALAEAVGDGKFEVQPKVMPQWRALVLSHVITWVCWLFGKKSPDAGDCVSLLSDSVL